MAPRDEKPSVDKEEPPVEEPKFGVTLVVHTVDRDSQKVPFAEITQQQLDNILATITGSLQTVVQGKSLTLVGTDGTIYIFNVDNVTCFEIRRS